jgi:hypothetical protein
MMNGQNKGWLEPKQLTSESEFKFCCHKRIACFTKCCSDISIILTPYDILRMKQRLNITSGEFLQKYTLPKTLDYVGLPVVTLKMLADENKSCPFLSPDGCTLYADRPATCRYYPIGFAALKEKDVKNKEEFYFFIREDHCLGFEENKEWTVQSWRKDQESDLYDRMNRDWAEILIKKQTMGQTEVTQKSIELYFMICYDLDRYRRFIFESAFLDRYDVPSDIVEKIRTDDVELLLLGLRWLKFTLFGERTITEKRS